MTRCELTYFYNQGGKYLLEYYFSIAYCHFTTYLSFLDEMCGPVEGWMYIEGTDDHCVILWDNLRAHMSPIIYQTIEAQDGPCCYSILPRPDYQPKHGPIQYKICDLLLHIQYNTNGEMNLDQTEQAIVSSSSAATGPFDSTFDHCGHSVDDQY